MRGPYGVLSVRLLTSDGLLKIYIWHVFFLCEFSLSFIGVELDDRVILHAQLKCRRARCLL